MVRSKLKKNKPISGRIDETPVDETKIPIPNLPENFVWMKVSEKTA